MDLHTNAQSTRSECACECISSDTMPEAIAKRSRLPTGAPRERRSGASSASQGRQGVAEASSSSNRLPWRPATQHDVARLAGVSQAAVSRWSSGRGYVASHVRQQIVDAAATLSYRPHPLAQGLSNGQSDIVAVVIANIANPGYQMMLEQITAMLQARGLQVLLFIAAPTESVDDVVPDVLRYLVRGVIITTSRLSSTAARQLVERGVPVVLFHRYTRSGGMHCVVCDNRDGARLAAEALRRAGARRLAFVGGNPDTSSNVDRRAGFLAEVRRLELPEPPALDGEFTYEWGHEAALRLFAAHPAIDGLFCADDEIATGAIDALRFQLGRSVPADVKVVGFDDHPIASKAAYALTTIRQPFDVMVREAIDLLLDGDGGRPMRRLLKGELVLRATA